MAAPMDQRIAVPVDDPNADTEWYGGRAGSLFLADKTLLTAASPM